MSDDFSLKHYDRTLHGLREAIFDQLEDLHNGRITHLDAKYGAQLAHAAIRVAELELHLIEGMPDANKKLRQRQMPSLPRITEN